MPDVARPGDATAGSEQMAAAALSRQATQKGDTSSLKAVRGQQQERAANLPPVQLVAQTDDVAQIDKLLKQLNDAGMALEAEMRNPEGGAWAFRDGEESDADQMQLRKTIALLNSAQLEKLEHDYQQKHGISLPDALLKNEYLSDGTKKSLEIYLHDNNVQGGHSYGIDKRTPEQQLQLAKLALPWHDLEMLSEALGGDTAAAKAARANFINNGGEPQVKNAFSGAEQALAMDIARDGHISLASIASQDMAHWWRRNRDHLESALTNASDAERNDYAAGRQLALSHTTPKNDQEKAQLAFYTRLHDALDYSPTDLAVFEDKLLRKGSIISDILRGNGKATDTTPSQTLHAISDALKQDPTLLGRLRQPKTDEDRTLRGNFDSLISDAMYKAFSSGPIMAPAEDGGYGSWQATQFMAKDFERQIFEKGKLSPDMMLPFDSGKERIKDILNFDPADRERFLHPKTQSDKDWKQKVMNSFSDKESQIVNNAIKQGQLDNADQMRAFMLGDGMSAAEMRMFLKETQKNPDKLQQLKDSFATKYGAPLQPELLASVDKSEQAVYAKLLSPVRTDGRQDYYDELSDYAKATSGISDSLIKNGLWDGTRAGLERELQDNTALRGQFARQFKDLPQDKQQELIERYSDALKAYRDSKGVLTDRIVDTALIAATLCTGGIAGSSVFSVRFAIAAATMGAAFKTGADAAMRGQDFDGGFRNLAKLGLDGGLMGALAAIPPAELAALLQIGDRAAAEAVMNLSKNLVTEGGTSLLKEGFSTEATNMLTRLSRQAFVSGKDMTEQSLEKVATALVNPQLAGPEKQQAIKAIADALLQQYNVSARAGTRSLVQSLIQGGKQWARESAINATIGSGASIAGQVLSAPLDYNANVSFADNMAVLAENIKDSALTGAAGGVIFTTVFHLGRPVVGLAARGFDHLSQSSGSAGNETRVRMRSVNGQITIVGDANNPDVLLRKANGKYVTVNSGTTYALEPGDEPIGIRQRATAPPNDGVQSKENPEKPQAPRKPGPSAEDLRYVPQTEGGLDRYKRNLKLTDSDFGPGKVVVDVGAGVQQNLAKDVNARHLGARVISVDPRFALSEAQDLEMFPDPDNRAARTQGRQHPQPDTVGAVAHELPIPSASVDGVYALRSTSIYQNKPEEIKANLLEFVRVLKDGGVAKIYPISDKNLPVYKQILDSMGVKYHFEADAPRPGQGAPDRLLVIEKTPVSPQANAPASADDANNPRTKTPAQPPRTENPSTGETPGAEKPANERPLDDEEEEFRSKLSPDQAAALIKSKGVQELSLNDLQEIMTNWEGIPDAQKVQFLAQFHALDPKPSGGPVDMFNSSNRNYVLDMLNAYGMESVPPSMRDWVQQQIFMRGAMPTRMAKASETQMGRQVRVWAQAFRQASEKLEPGDKLVQDSTAINKKVDALASEELKDWASEWGFDLQDLSEHSEMRSLMGKDSKLQKDLDAYEQGRKALEPEIVSVRTRMENYRSNLQNVINEQAKRLNIPAPRLELVDDLSSLGQFSAQDNTIRLKTSQLSNQRLAADTIAHELTHGEQYALVIRNVAQQTGMSGSPSAAQLEALRESLNQRLARKFDEATDDYLRDVLAEETQPLSAAEKSRAQALEDSFKDLQQRGQFGPTETKRLMSGLDRTERLLAMNAPWMMVEGELKYLEPVLFNSQPAPEAVARLIDASKHGDKAAQKELYDLLGRYVSSAKQQLSDNRYGTYKARLHEQEAAAVGKAVQFANNPGSLGDKALDVILGKPE